MIRWKEAITNGCRLAIRLTKYKISNTDKGQQQNQKLVYSINIYVQETIFRSFFSATKCKNANQVLFIKVKAVERQYSTTLHKKQFKFFARKLIQNADLATRLTRDTRRHMRNQRKKPIHSLRVCTKSNLKGKYNISLH